MKPSHLLVAAAAALGLSACVPPPPGAYPPPVPDPPRPGYPHPGYPSGPPMESAKDKAYDQGFMFGRKDAMQGRQSNYMLYNNYYNSATKKDFAAGYMAAYRRFSRW